MLNFIKEFSFRHTGILLLYLFAVTVLGSFVVGPLSVRVYATALMLFYLLLNIGKFNNPRVVPITKTYIKLYVVFLVIFFICLVITGDLMLIGFFRRFLAYDLVCLVTFFAIYLKVNSQTQIRQIVLFLMLICLFDALITIMQITGQELGWSVGRFIAHIEEAEEYADSHVGILAVSFAPGIFANVVSNAFNLASFSPLAITYFNNRTVFLFSIIFTIICIIAIFLTQQRAAFYLYLLTLIIYFFSLFTKKPIYGIGLIIIVLAAGEQIGNYFASFDFGRLMSGIDDSRSSMWNYALQFIPEHFLFGGVSDFTKVTGLSAHNLFFDSFIFAGVGGFITLMIFDLKVGVHCARQTIFFIKNKCSQLTFALAMSMTTCTLYGFTHNTSVLTGDVVVFIILALLLKSIQLDKIQREN